MPRGDTPPIGDLAKTSVESVLSGASRWHVEHGDCLQVLRGMPDASVDSVVTDPPYGLGREPSPKELEAIVRAWAAGEEVTVKGRGFMARQWDAFVPGSAIWKEAFRVLKPGGHLLSFAGTRTVDLMGLSIRLAGFEIRDQLQWLYGSGMPKSLNVSRVIDAHLGVERPIVGTRTLTGSAALSAAEKGGTFASGTSSAGRSKVVEVTAPGSPEAQQWDGWGTGLSPSHEPIILARKPLTGTVAENVLAHGTGGLNVDGCRIEASGHDGRSRQDGPLEAHPLGRWPANVILDEGAGVTLDAQAGDRPGMSGGGVHRAEYDGGMFGAVDSPGTARGDSGGPSRFFYCAKASRSERDSGLQHFVSRSGGEATGREDGSIGTGNARAGAGRTGGSRNAHPTVKPDDLMRWLVRLITPPGGLVLDPFTGSGSTGRAALLEGFCFLGIELNDTDEEPFVSIARARIDHVEGREVVPRESLRAAEPPKQRSLFEGAL